MAVIRLICMSALLCFLLGFVGGIEAQSAMVLRSSVSDPLQDENPAVTFDIWFGVTPPDQFQQPSEFDYSVRWTIQLVPTVNNENPTLALGPFYTSIQEPFESEDVLTQEGNTIQYLAVPASTLFDGAFEGNVIADDRYDTTIQFDLLRVDSSGEEEVVVSNTEVGPPFVSILNLGQQEE